jgi:hypothetical protein
MFNMLPLFRLNYRYFRLSMVFIPFLLTACHSDFGPYPMPTGYKYHDTSYKTPPGPEPVAKNIEDRIEHIHSPNYFQLKKVQPTHTMPVEQVSPPVAPELNESMPMFAPEPALMAPPVTGSWDQAAFDLVRRLVDGFGTPTESIFVRPAPGFSQAEMNLEMSLRKALQDKGLSIAPAPGMGPFELHYSFSDLENISASERIMVNIELRDSQGNVLAQESGIYSSDAPMSMTMPMQMETPYSVDEPPVPSTAERQPVLLSR